MLPSSRVQLICAGANCDAASDWKILGSYTTPWYAYTMVVYDGASSLSNITVNSACYRCVGDSVEVSFDIKSTANQSGSTGLRFGLPGSLTPDTSSVGNFAALGSASFYDATSYDNSSSLAFTTGTGSDKGVSLIKPSTSSIYLGNDLVINTEVSGHFVMPITGWNN